MGCVIVCVVLTVHPAVVIAENGTIRTVLSSRPPTRDTCKYSRQQYRYAVGRRSERGVIEHELDRINLGRPAGLESSFPELSLQLDSCPKKRAKTTRSQTAPTML